MYVWIVLLSLILPPPMSGAPEPSAEDDAMRYRGIERLLAKFDAEASPNAAVASKRPRNK